ncbi:type II toxin-antitoxin system RatA family toxin [Coralliovum pocilloporae]|uniref:type II toxin-antitoxin system RatA family toxin n=1 Tax=Coralliovum pocilloporae TaxID=3066369 RepID=UPI003306B360
MPKFQSRKLVRHTPDEMFRLVADVERYPEFVPLCDRLQVRGRKVQDDGREILIANMTVAYKLVRETFTSKVTLDPAQKLIVAEYLDGPFEHLENRWTFLETEGGCHVDFYIDYEFRSKALGILMGAMFDKAFRKFSDAFEQRAGLVYG